MYFLLRTTFWVGLILLLLPIGTGSDDDTPTIGVVQVYLAAQSTIRDLSGFCGRNPNACEMGGSIIKLVGLKAKEAARLTYTYLNDGENDEAQPTQIASYPSAQDTLETIPFDEVASGQILPRLDNAAEDLVYSGALTSTDRQIPWQLSQGQQDSPRTAEDRVTQNLFDETQPTYATPFARVPVPRPNPLYLGGN
ncbi:hypothetical protein PsAD2_00953 [Pseudovibrio axinellae]|uniref:Uncharacterized protein n=1 Tax=Pseudovibrio axinellae TaxID=989403 RepID=A0A166AEC4_9HYPH|nr:DUF5330 domain-containing protein [Pseudovibrio axinellae]KZL20961.1 hypothetical protein PsAD2_00953 [Pseudovibrio axinellae]SEP81201.1 hypothetical protein SAMN05421798_101448 [Pseudovibrio axinellae]